MQETIVLGVVSSIIASIVFYLWMIMLKPRFKISPQISYLKGANDNILEFRVKVVNHSRSILNNVSYSLLYCAKRPDDIKDVYHIEPKKSSLSIIDKYNRENTDYAIRLSYDIDTTKYPLTDMAVFIFTFQANHSFSNAMGIKRVTYCTSDIVEGIFETGKSTKILGIR